LATKPPDHKDGWWSLLFKFMPLWLCDLVAPIKMAGKALDPLSGYFFIRGLKFPQHGLTAVGLS
jgi:hypothetical protein